MPIDIFENRKKSILSKKDKSKKQEIDKEMLPVINLINKNKNYYTTSSCSGRIKLIEIAKKKHLSNWVYVTHKKAGFKEIKSHILPSKGLWFVQEPIIIHICCRTMEDAGRLIYLARKAELKDTGLISIKNLVAQVRGTERIEFLVSKDNKILVNDEFLKAAVNEANKKLALTRKRLNNFYRLIKAL